MAVNIKTEDINIRDPYILVHDNVYYLYGTRSETCWGQAEGFDCYMGADLENWEGPIEIFKRPKDFWADRNFWAPECYYYKGRFYLVTTFGNELQKGIQILVADDPTGPFVPLSEGTVTPKEWKCIDGTLYIDDFQRPYLLFSHSFEDCRDGDMCCVQLSDDLTHVVSEIRILFCAAKAEWPRPIPFAEKEFGIKEAVYFTDGPCPYTFKDGGFGIIWSSWCTKGYAVGVAVSESNMLEGPYRHNEALLFKENGGHGMYFRDLEGNTRFVLHYPNDKYMERPVFYHLKEEGNTLKLL